MEDGVVTVPVTVWETGLSFSLSLISRERTSLEIGRNNEDTFKKKLNELLPAITMKIRSFLLENIEQTKKDGDIMNEKQIN